MIDGALKTSGGLEAAQFLLGQRYIHAYQQVAKKGNTIIIPSEPVKISDQVADSLTFFQKIKPLTVTHHAQKVEEAK